jgi:hypothetical protein
MRIAFILSVVAAVVVGILVFCGHSSSAAIPHLINYQGMLTDNSGTPLTGSYSITFKIYNDPSAGTKKWEETQSSVAVTNGLFNVILGSVNSINLDFSEDYWLDLTVGAEHMPTRLRFTSVGYAYRAQVADTAYATAPGAGSHWSVGDSVLYTNKQWGIARGGAGNVLTGAYTYTHVNLGVACTTGSASPNAFYCTISGGRFNCVFDGDATVGGGYGNSARLPFSTVGGGHENLAQGLATTVSGGYTNVAYSNYDAVGGGFNNTASGVYSTVPGGYQDSAAGYCSFAAGRRAKALHAGSFVWADSTNADFNSQGNNTFNIRASGGVYSISNSTAYGAWFQNSGNGDGVRAYTNVSKGHQWGAVYAVNYGTSPAIYADGGDTTAYFNGSVVVTGTLYKGSLAFVIDHPLDPENKYLYHSGVESPDMKNVYDGLVTLDGNGEAWVDLPEWFEALNKDFRYQLTCLGAFAPVYIAQKISNHRFKISGGQPGMEISWQVTGIRHDPYAENNRIQVEAEKPAEERGKYLHPDAYHLPETMGINYTNEENKK